MSDVRQLLIHAGQYLAGRAGLMLLGFLSFPVLTRVLSVSQYGELSLALKLCLLWTVLSKCGIQNAALRFFPEHSKQSPQAKLACSSTLLLSVAGIAGGMMLVGFGVIHLPQLIANQAVLSLAPLLLVLAFVRSIQPTFSGLLRSERRAWLFNTCELSGKSMGILFSILALVFIAHDLRFYLSGLVTAEACVMIGIGIWFYRNGMLSGIAFRPELARSAIAFSVPLIAYELTSVILDSGDRILIGRYLGMTQVGLYSAAYSVATYAEEALMTPVNMALMPGYMKVWVTDGAEATVRFLNQALDLFIMGAGAIAMLVYTNAVDLLSLLASRKFAAASTLLPVLVLGLLIYAIHIFFNAPLIIHKRSMVLTAVTSSCCIANIGMNILMLPRFGIAGAAWATLFSYVLMVGALAILSRRYLVIRIPIWTLASVVALVFCIALLMGRVSFPSPWLNLAVKVPASLTLYVIGLLALRPTLRSRILIRARRSVVPKQFTAAEQS
jgi:O-antigen/teichoic acid export membrane protein